MKLVAAATGLTVITLSTPARALVFGGAVGADARRPTTPPAGATMQCRDGTYSFSASKGGACWGHGGVLRVLSTKATSRAPAVTRKPAAKPAKPVTPKKTTTRAKTAKR